MAVQRRNTAFSNADQESNSPTLVPGVTFNAKHKRLVNCSLSLIVSKSQSSFNDESALRSEGGRKAPKVFASGDRPPFFAVLDGVEADDIFCKAFSRMLSRNKPATLGTKSGLARNASSM